MSQKRRQVIEIFAPTGGHNYALRSTFLDPRAQPDGINARLSYELNRKEFGNNLYATGSGSVLGGPINGLFEAVYPSGSILEVFTPSKVYKYTAGTDTYVSDGQTFTGTYSDYWSVIMHNDALLYCNGVDPIQYKSAISGTGVIMPSATQSGGYKANCLMSFKTHLCLYNTIESGFNNFKRVRWTKSGILTYSAASTDFASGVAGFVDLVDAEGDVQVAAPLSGAAAIYSQRSIHIQTWVGGTDVFQFTKTISGIGTPSRRGVVAAGDANYMIGWDNVYRYRGGSDLQSIGDSIRPRVFTQISDSQIGASFIEYDYRNNEILCHFPLTSTATAPTETWVYRIDDDNWTRLNRQYTAAGRFSRATGLTIGELQGNIGQQNYKFGDTLIHAGAITRLYGDYSGHVMKVDETVYSVVAAGVLTPQTYQYTTPDLVGFAPTGVSPWGKKTADPLEGNVVDYTTMNKRWTQLMFEATGTGSMTVSYSTDAGKTTSFPANSSVALSVTGTTHVIDLDNSSRMQRFNFTNTGTYDNCGISYVKVEFIPSKEQP